MSLQNNDLNLKNKKNDSRNPKIEIDLLCENRDSSFRDFTVELQLKGYFCAQYFFSVELDVLSNTIYFLTNENDNGCYDMVYSFRLIDICRMMSDLNNHECNFDPFFSIKDGNFVINIEDSIQCLELSKFDVKSLKRFKQQWKKMYEWIIKEYS